MPAVVFEPHLARRAVVPVAFELNLEVRASVTLGERVVFFGKFHISGKSFVHNFLEQSEGSRLQHTPLLPQSLSDLQTVVVVRYSPAIVRQPNLAFLVRHGVSDFLDFHRNPANHSGGLGSYTGIACELNIPIIRLVSLIELCADVPPEGATEGAGNSPKCSDTDRHIFALGRIPQGVLNSLIFSGLSFPVEQCARVP